MYLLRVEVQKEGWKPLENFVRHHRMYVFLSICAPGVWNPPFEASMHLKGNTIIRGEQTIN